MTYFEVSTMREGYAEIVQHVAQHGERQCPRGLPTRALSNVHIRVEDPKNALPTNTGRGVKLAIGAVEAVQIVGAFQDPALMVRVSPNFMQFMNNGRFWGGYGDRIENQMLAVAQKLVKDPDSRQAVVTLWRPRSDNVTGKHDYPCTLSLVFQRFNNKLEMSVTMRSNDVWLGLAYDVFVFTQLQFTLARFLDLEPGPYHHHAVNLHVYERDLEQVQKLHPPRMRDVDTQPQGFGRHAFGDFYGTLMRARAIGQGKTITKPTPDERWFISRLAPYVP